MPTYAYACTSCDHRFEAVQSFSDDSLTSCPQCEGRLRKVFSAVGVVFKGSGFYRTDSRSGGSSATLPAGGGSDSGSTATKTKTETSSRVQRLGRRDHERRQQDLQQQRLGQHVLRAGLGRLRHRAAPARPTGDGPPPMTGAGHRRRVGAGGRPQHRTGSPHRPQPVAPRRGPDGPPLASPA